MSTTFISFLKQPSILPVLPEIPFNPPSSPRNTLQSSQFSQKYPSILQNILQRALKQNNIQTSFKEPWHKMLLQKSVLALTPWFKSSLILTTKKLSTPPLTSFFTNRQFITRNIHLSHQETLTTSYFQDSITVQHYFQAFITGYNTNSTR